MVFPTQPLPQISISLAPPELPAVEPYSPFAWDNKAFGGPADDGYRPTHLTPPPTDLHFKHRSPLAPPKSATAAQNDGKGIDRGRFEALLKATRERSAGNREHDLRKEIALKAHKSKQVERRALFLSKVMAPPSPTATTLPKTPPESPAIFHYSLPSPGLVSPLALFGSLNDRSTTGPLSYGRDPWVEQVDFRRRNKLKLAASAEREVPRAPSAPKALPSLDQISARLAASATIHVSSPEGEHRATRLPAFLARARQQTPSPPAGHEKPKPSRIPGGLDRLRQRVQAPQPVPATSLLPPKSPMSPMLSPNIEVTTTLVPRTSALFPTTRLSERNLHAFECRERRAKDMLSTLRRRTTRPSEYGYNGHDDDVDGVDADAPADDRRWKRRSAPAELSPRPRAGFEHPVLALPGAF